MVHERLKILLKELNISQRQFAMKIHLDTGYFSKIIHGKVNPPDRILLLIENVFHVNKEWLENGQGEIFSDQDMPLAKAGPGIHRLSERRTGQCRFFFYQILNRKSQIVIR